MSKIPFLSITYLVLIPEAFSINSVEEYSSFNTLLLLMASLLASLKESTYALNDSTISSLLIESSGYQIPVPAIYISDIFYMYLMYAFIISYEYKHIYG